MDHTSPHPSRRDVLAGIAGLSLAVGGGLGDKPAQAAAAFGTGSRSKMSWHSGCAISRHADFAAYRGRAIDTITTWCPHDTWTDIVSLKGGFATARRSGARISLALPALPRSHNGTTSPQNWKNAANGTYDGYYTEFAKKLAASGPTDVIVRAAGWECNDRGRPWFCATDSGAFKATFARIARIVRQWNPTALIEWNNIKKGAQPDSILNYYPGDDVCDIVGVNYYDGWPPLSSQSVWDSQFYAEAPRKGGPWGIGAWAEFARSRGKRFSLSEWGINAGRYSCVDNPLYIENMHDFFSTTSWLAYENYFNQKNYHQLTPTDVNPKSSAKYKQLWA